MSCVGAERGDGDEGASGRGAVRDHHRGPVAERQPAAAPARPQALQRRAAGQRARPRCLHLRRRDCHRGEARSRSAQSPLTCQYLTRSPLPERFWCGMSQRSHLMNYPATAWFKILKFTTCPGTAGSCAHDGRLQHPEHLALSLLPDVSKHHQHKAGALHHRSWCLL